MAKQQPSFLILQFDPLKQSITKLSCKMTHTPSFLRLFNTYDIRHSE